MLLNPMRRRVREHRGFPVLPGSFPLLGHLPAMMTDALGLMRRAEREVGPFFWAKAGFGQDSLYCLHPEVFAIFRNKVTTSVFLQEVASDFLGRSLLVHDGALHQHMRSAMNGPFLPPGLTAADTGAVLADLVERGVRRWVERGEVRILAEARELALAAIFRVMGIPEADLPEWRRHYEAYVLLALNIPVDLPGFPRPRGRRARTWLNERLLAAVQQSRARSDNPGLLAALVHARDEEGSPLTDVELLDNLRLLVLAGHETSASTIAWMVILLGQRPDLWETLSEEAGLAGSVPRRPRDLKRFPFAEALFRETLRLYPPVSTDARLALVDFELGGRTVPAGAQVSISIAHLSRHPAVYDRPDELRPERWLGRQEPISPVELVQFGGGPHFCLGYHLAWMEIVQTAVALALALRERRLRPHLLGPFPSRRYVPLLHPAPRTRVRFA